MKKNIVFNKFVKNLVNQCSSFPCQNGGTCTPSGNYTSFTCSCTTGYYGNTCQTNPCQTNQAPVKMAVLVCHLLILPFHVHA